MIRLVLLCCFCSYKYHSIITDTIRVEKLQEDLPVFRSFITKVHADAYIYNIAQQPDHLFDSIIQSIRKPVTLRDFYNKVDEITGRLRCVHLKPSPDHYVNI